MQKQHIQLTAEDKHYLVHLLAKGSLKARVSKRAMALLALDQGATLQAVTQLVLVSPLTMMKWRHKYVAQGLSFLEDQPRSGRPVS